MACLPLGIVIGEAAVLGEDLEAHVEKARRQPACRGAALGCRMSGVGCWVSGKDIRVSARSRTGAEEGGSLEGSWRGGRGGTRPWLTVNANTVAPYYTTYEITMAPCSGSSLHEYLVWLYLLSS